jgi:hypothetical protein
LEGAAALFGSLRNQRNPVEFVSHCTPTKESPPKPEAVLSLSVYIELSTVAVAAGVAVGVTVGVDLGVLVALDVGVAVGGSVDVRVTVGVAIGVPVGVTVG